MNTEEKIKLCDKLLKELAKSNRVFESDVCNIIKSTSIIDYNSIIHTLIGDGLIIEYSGNMRDKIVEITTSGIIYAKRGYEKYIDDKELLITKQIRYYKTTSTTAIMAAVLSAIAIVLSFMKLFA